MRGFLRRVLAGVGLFVAVAGLAVFVTAAAGVWRLKAEVNRRSDDLAGKADKAVDAADHAVALVREVLDSGEKDLKGARAEQKAPTAAAVNPFVRIGARQTAERLAGSVERADAAVTAASDAVVVAQKAIDLFGQDEQFKSWFGVHPEQVSQTQIDLFAANRELQRVRDVLGVPLASGAAPTEEQLAKLDGAIRQGRAFTDQMELVVATIRTRLHETKRAVDLWSMRVAVGVTAVGVLGELGQLFMARFFWRLLRRLPA
jgi:hypothetical protein